MSMTANQLATSVRDASPRIKAMIEALMQAQADIVGHEIGKVELAFAPHQVKMSLVVSLGCVKFDRLAETA